MITIDLAPRSKDYELSVPALTRFLNRARTAVGLLGAVDVLLTGDSTIRRLNKSFRGKDKTTDVLSFPAPTAFAKKHAGDLAISLEVAGRQAKAYGHSLSEEVKVLTLHGLLHLAGEDHETDKGRMAAREVALRQELRLQTALIERAMKIERPTEAGNVRGKAGSSAKKKVGTGRKKGLAAKRASDKKASKSPGARSLRGAR
jgi:probable rRNA maturation factor